MATPQFHVPGPGPYALTHSVGCLPAGTEQALRRSVFEPWELEGGDAWGAWLAVITDFRESLAGLLGGVAAEYCPQTNLSSGLAKLLPALPRSGRAVLLAAEDAFPSLVFGLEAARRGGYSTRLIPRDQDPAALASWDRALTADVAAVLVTHVHSNTGTVAPAAEIAALCRARGIRCIVDVAQSAGILPVSVTDIGADAILGSCIKWLCGGPGAGFLWVNPAWLADLEPVDVGWFSHEDPFEFDVRSFRYAPDARRFWGGTPSVAPYAVAAHGLRVIRDIGIGTIGAHNRRLTDAFHAGLPARWRAGSVPLRRGGTVCLDLGADFERVMRALRARAVRCDTRGSVVRLSFHLYNTAEEAGSIAECWS
jgi:kynureninase